MEESTPLVCFLPLPKTYLRKIFPSAASFVHISQPQVVIDGHSFPVHFIAQNRIAQHGFCEQINRTRKNCFQRLRQSKKRPAMPGCSGGKKSAMKSISDFCALKSPRAAEPKTSSRPTPNCRQASTIAPRFCWMRPITV